jgi:uncharacterized membrane protein (TIGR02234 family)
VALAWSGASVWTGRLEDRSVEVLGAGRGAAVEVEVVAAWPSLAVVAGFLGAAVGGFVVVRGRGWPAMGRRYERATATTGVSAHGAARTDEDRAQDAWKALDRGEDPTDGEPAAQRSRPA